MNRSSRGAGFDRIGADGGRSVLKLFLRKSKRVKAPFSAAVRFGGSVEGEGAGKVVKIFKMT